MARQTKRPILMVSVTPFKGGGETHDAKLAQLLAERYELQAVVSNPWLKDQMVNLGIPVTRIRSTGLMGRYALFALVILKHCLLSRPAAAHLNGQGEAYFSPLFKLFGIKTVIARHTPLNIVNNWIKRIVVSVCYRLADKVICVSSVVRRDMENIIHHDRIITISNWLMDEEFSCPRQFHATSEPFSLLFVGRLVEFKGAHDLIDAMKHLDACSLEIVGDGPEREELTNRARDLPVRFEGVVDDCIPFYDRADLLVFPSYPLEGQGQTPLEAMARGLPCLLSDIEVTRETSDCGRVAAIFHHGDVEDLVQKIKQLRDPVLRTTLSHSGFERVRDHYSAAVVQPLYFKVFDELARA